MAKTHIKPSIFPKNLINVAIAVASLPLKGSI